MATATRKVKQDELRELLDIELEEKSLKAKLEELTKRKETVNAELLRLLIDKRADIEKGELYAIVKDTPGRATVAWAKVCEEAMGKEFCDRQRAEAPKTEGSRKVQVVKR